MRHGRFSHWFRYRLPLSASGWRAWLEGSMVNRITLFAIAMTVALTVLIGSASYAVMLQMARQQVALAMEHQISLAVQPVQNELNNFVKDIAELSHNSFIANGLVDSVGREVYLRPFLRDHNAPLQQDIDIVLADFNAVPIAANRATDLTPFANLPGASRALLNATPLVEIQPAAEGGTLWLFHPVVFPPTGMAEGVIIARLDLARLLTREPAAQSASYSTRLRIGGITLADGKAQELERAPEEYIVSTRALRLAPPLDHLGAEISLGQPRRVAYASLQKLIVGHMLLGALVLLLAFYVARKSARRLAAPLVALSQTAGRIAGGGELAMTVPVSSSDEVGRLAHAFEGMLGKLRASYADLEARVLERTAQLSRINASLSAEIARRERTETELVEARNVAEAASRAKSEFLANMSHEIRTPMNAVLGLAHLLGSTPLTAEQRKTLEMIRVSGQSLLGILNDILDLSRIEAGRMDLAPAPFKLGDMLDALAGIMTVSVGDKDVELAIGLAPGVPEHLVGDVLRLQQVLINLIGNAIKFTQQGEVVLTVRALPEEGQETDRCTLQFSVRDTGIGIDEVQQTRLFSPFTQADASTTRRFGGSGLGLAICKRLVELMGGSIAVRSKPLVGSEFTVTVSLQRAPEPASAAPGRSRRVLLVDPHRASLEGIEQTMHALAWRVDAVASMEAAAASVQAAAEQAEAGYDALLVARVADPLEDAQRCRLAKALAASSRMQLLWLARAGLRVADETLAAESDAEIVLRKPVTASALREALRLADLRRLGRTRGISLPVPVLELASTLGTAANSGRSADVQEKAERAAERALSGARVLVVEDNPLNQLVARGMLERAGASVEVAGNGVEAIKRLRDGDAPCDFVLMDVQMPLMDGFATTRMIRDELRLRVPVLAMTAGVLAFEREQCLAAGMDDFIPKPIDLEQMSAAIARHWKRPPAHPDMSADHDETGRGVAADNPWDSTAAAAVEGVFDLEQIHRLLAENSTYGQTFTRLIRDVVQAGKAPVTEAGDAWREGRPEEAARRLHALRGTVGLLGARRLAEASRLAEQAMRAADATAVSTLLSSVERELDATLQAAGRWLAERAHEQQETS